MLEKKFFRKLFWIGSQYGVRNLWAGGLRHAGLKRTLGFILQPVENWSRYPEFFSAFNFLPEFSQQSKILDLGSPKMFGVYLATQKPGSYTLTDIWPAAVDEFKTIVKISNRIGQGSIELGVEDATKLKNFPDNSFDCTYSISVLEHIKDRQGTIQAIKEVQRVLKPGGSFILSMPVAHQRRDMFKSESIYKENFKGEPLFFAHFYDAAEIQDVCRQLEKFVVRQYDVISWRLKTPLLRFWLKVPQKIRGALGIINLMIAPWSFSKISGTDINRLQIHEDGDIVIRFVKI